MFMSASFSLGNVKSILDVDVIALKFLLTSS